MEKLLEISDITLIPRYLNRGKRETSLNDYFIDDLGIKCLPIFVSPSPSIVDVDSAIRFNSFGIRSILPRNIQLSTRLRASSQGTFSAYSIDEVIENFINTDRRSQKNAICIDVGNGHEIRLLDLCSNLKDIYGNNLIIMAGNVSNPDTYFEYSKRRIDYIRLGISSGSQVDKDRAAFNYPIASLLLEIKKLSRNIPLSFKTKIIVDGGINNMTDIVKCLALGADYVMVGKLFAKLAESSKSQLFTRKNTKSPFDKVINSEVIDIFTCYRFYEGNSMNRRDNDVKSGEFIKVTESLGSWTEDLKGVLDNAFMLSDSRTFQEFREKIHYGVK